MNSNPFVHGNEAYSAGKARLQHLIFTGTREEILNYYDELEQALEDAMKQLQPGDERVKDYQDTLAKITGARNYILKGKDNDNAYNNNKEIIDAFIGSVIRADDELSYLYSIYQERIKEYEEVSLSGDKDAIAAAYDKVTAAFEGLKGAVNKDNVDIADPDDVKNWITDIQNKFDETVKEVSIYAKLKVELDDPKSVANKIKNLVNGEIKDTDITDVFLKNYAEKIKTGEVEFSPITLDNVLDWSTDIINNPLMLLFSMISQGAQQAGVDVETFIDILVELGIIQKDVASQEPVDFAVSKYRDSLDSLSDSLAKLKSARDKYMKGTLSDEELFKLIYDKDNGFPELANYINDLGTGLKVIADSKVDEVLKELEEVDVDGLTDEGLATYNRLINYLNDIKSGFDDASAAQEKFRSAMSETSSTIKTLVSMREEIEKNGKLSRDSVLTLLSDDKYRSVWNSLVDNNIAGYTKAINDLIKKEEGEFNALAKNILRSESEHAINEKKQEIDEFEKLYQIDLSNWENLSEDKKKELINTDAELLAKQKKLINEFNDTYKTDILQYKNSLEAKEALYAEHKAKMLKQAFNEYVGENGITVSNGEIHVPAYEGNFTSDEYKEFNTFLKDNLGITVQDYLAWVKNGKSIDDLIKGKIGNDYEAAKKAYDELLKELGLSNPYDESEFDINNFLDDKSQSASSETKQTLDWIERRLKKFAQTTKEVYADVEKYTDFTGKNSQLNKSISAIKDEIQANTDAYNAYLSAANAVSLDESYKSKVRNGTLNIETIKDSDLRDKISQYQDLYDKAQSCKDTIESLKKTEKEYASQQLSNIEKYYSNRQKQAQNSLSYYTSADTDNLYIVKNYGGIRDSYKQQIQESENEAAQLQATLNDLTTRGLIDTDEWNEWNDKIVQCNLNTKNLKKSLRDLADEELNDIANKWENRNSLLEDENNYLSTIADDSFHKKNKDYAGLRKNYAQQIKNESASAIELQNRLDQAVANGEIEKYSKKWYEWVNKINDSRESSVKLEQSLHELYVEELNDIKNLHDTNIGLLDSQLEREKLRNDNNSKKGNYWDVELDYLEKSSEIAKEKRKELLDERAEIVKKFDVAKKQGLEEGSEAWNQFVSAINDADEALLNVDNDTKEIANSIRDLPINKLEHILDVISKIRGVIEGIQSLHEAQGFDRTADEIYSSINASGVEMQKAMAKRDTIYQKMLAGEYGEIGSTEYQDAEGQLLDLTKEIYGYQIEQEQEYDKLIDLSIDKLNKQKEEMQEQNAALEKRLSLEKAILALEKAKYQKNKLVYHEGVGFVYEADQNAVRDAQEQLDSQYRQSVLDYFDRAVKALEEYKKFNNIYDYAGNNLTDLALSDGNLHFDPSKFTEINTESDFLYKNQKSYLDPEVAKLYHSMFSNISVPQEYYDSSASLAKSAEKISSNFANIKAGDTIQLTIGKDAINLSGVNDTNKLAQAIINEFPTQFVQALARKKK